METSRSRLREGVVWLVVHIPWWTNPKRVHRYKTTPPDACLSSIHWLEFVLDTTYFDGNKQTPISACMTSMHPWKRTCNWTPGSACYGPTRVLWSHQGAGIMLNFTVGFWPDRTTPKSCLFFSLKSFVRYGTCCVMCELATRSNEFRRSQTLELGITFRRSFSLRI